jgi:Uma2 family endonuclease
MPTGTQLTIDDFELLPDELAENHELVDGVLVDVSGNTDEHNSIRDYLIALLRPLVSSQRLGRVIGEQEFDFRGNAYAPDVSFYGPKKVSLRDRRKRVQRFVPDLAIEIASPSNSFDSLLVKKNRYIDAGVQEVWLISSEAQEVHVHTPRTYAAYRKPDTLTTPLLPGLIVILTELFNAADDD